MIINDRLNDQECTRIIINDRLNDQECIMIIINDSLNDQECIKLIINDRLNEGFKPKHQDPLTALKLFFGKDEN